jgi:hypothetical protein
MENMNPSGAISNPIPYSGQPSGDPPKRMTPEEIAKELELRYSQFQKDLHNQNKSRENMSSKARKRLKWFEFGPEIRILARNLQGAEKIFRKLLAQNNLTLEKKNENSDQSSTPNNSNRSEVGTVL